jgi:hypothetical protein
MTKTKSHFTLVAILVAAAMVVAGSVAIASNTGFKANKAMVPRLGTSTGQVGNNWLSLPYFNPYGNFAGLCTQTGLISAGITRATVTKIEPNGATTTAQCGTAAAGAPAANIIPGLGVRVTNAGTGAPTSIILVGSHNPSLVITVPAKGVGPIGNYWFAVPYHTTAVTAADLCLSSGLTSTGLNRGSVTRLNASSGAFTSANCGTAGASTLTLVLGEAVRLTNPTVPVSFIPAHF